MKYYKIVWVDGKTIIVPANNSLEVIRKYDLCTKENINTRVIELAGEQQAIAQSNEE